jgi:zinc/manganese transport system substrate-binding protein/zinc transport system substrate-binding protein
MKYTRIAGLVALIAAGLTTVVASGSDVLCTTFPLYQITRNVSQGRNGVNVGLLLPASLGCPHHYSLTPQDMQKLARADVLVVNGLGMEEFLGAPVKKANPRLRVVDSSVGIEGVLQYAGDDDHAHADGHDHAEAHDHAHHHHAGANPHLFASPRMAAVLAENIAAGLSKADPEGASVYFKNAKAYAGRMNALADEMAAAVKTLRNNRIVQPHGVFDYLARDIGLEVVAVTQPHGQEPSAAEMLKLAGTIREKKAGAVITEPQYSAKVGQTLAKETGIPSAVLDPVASGPENAPLDYYEQTMRKNLETLRVTLGVKE